MKIKSISKFTALLLALTLMLSSFSTANGAVSNAEPLKGSTYNTYFNDVYPKLADKNPVYKTTTIEDLVRLFESDGTYAILFGGAWSDQTQASIGFINDVAKEYGVETIYNFDTRLDGNTAEIADSSNKFANYYVDLVKKYLPNITTLYDKNDGNPNHNVSYTSKIGVRTANKIQAPFLFIYNKNHKDAQNNSAPIITQLESTKVWNDFLTNGQLDQIKVNAYKVQIRTVFETIATKKIAKVDTLANFEFYKTPYNDKAKVTILEAADSPVVYEHITYHQLTKLLNSKGNYALLFGGSWCPNTQAIIKYANEYAKKHNINKIYVWDTKLDAGSSISAPEDVTINGNALQIRATGHPYANLYVDLVNTYLTNINTLYDKNDGIASHNISYTDANGIKHVSNKLQVPFLFTYNKEHKDVQGNSAPIIGSVEYMFTWNNIQPDYASTSGTGINYKIYTTANDKLFTKLASLPTKPLFVDASKNWAKANIAYLYNEGLIGGYADGTFKPNNSITRQEFSLMLAKAREILPTKNTQLAFKDAKTIQDWAIGYVKALVDAKIISGYADGTYKPNKEITRTELAVIIVKALNEQPDTSSTNIFEDVASIPHWAIGYVAKATELGLIVGTSKKEKTYFNPNDFATRAEVSTIIARTLK